jgi:site-specific recombinase XerD
MNEAGAIDLDVAARVAFPQRVSARVDVRPVLSFEEIELAIASIDGKSPVALRDRAVLKVLVYTGIRNSELRALTIDDADFDDRTLLVRHGKGNKMRIVPMGRAAAALEWYVREARPKLAGLLANGALFLSRERRPLARKTLEGIVQRRLGVSPHRLRHACATSMIREGARGEKVQAILGHASSETTKIYVH